MEVVTLSAKRDSEREREKEQRREKETWKVAMSVSLLHIQMQIRLSGLRGRMLKQRAEKKQELIFSVFHQTWAELRGALCLLFKC